MELDSATSPRSPIAPVFTLFPAVFLLEGCDFVILLVSLVADFLAVEILVAVWPTVGRAVLTDGADELFTRTVPGVVLFPVESLLMGLLLVERALLADAVEIFAGIGATVLLFPAESLAAALLTAVVLFFVEALVAALLTVTWAVTADGAAKLFAETGATLVLFRSPDNLRETPSIFAVETFVALSCLVTAPRLFVGKTTFDFFVGLLGTAN
mmetsp:Transcript_43540/g.85239  ORF Transcript_43540/g.85239 Transcript_43540/m.85239 type:complete len:212 (-) Transcript_43540:467-1102(-)